MPEPLALELVELCSRLHAELAAAVSDLDDAGCNWAPAEGAAAVGALVVHVLRSEAEAFVEALAGRPFGRGGDGEPPVVGVRSRRELLVRLDDAERRLRGAWAPAVLHADARALRRLLADHGHARQHLGQLLLTARLYREARARAELRPCATRP